MLTDRKIAKGIAHRTNISSADVGPDISDKAGALSLMDQLHVSCILECSAGGVTGSICLALWDKDGIFMGITDEQSFRSNSLWRVGASGPYVTPPLIFDTLGASQIKALVKELSAGISQDYLSCRLPSEEYFRIERRVYESRA